MDYYDDSINDSVDMVDEINNEENEEIPPEVIEQVEAGLESSNSKKRGRGVTSFVWDYFDRLPNDRALCRGWCHFVHSKFY